MTKPVAPRFSQASCNRRPAVRSTASTSTKTAPTWAVDSASSATASASCSSRAQTWISRRAGNPSPARPGANRSSRRRIQTASPRRARGAATSAAKAAGQAPVSASMPAPANSCHWPSGSPPPGRHASISGAPNGRVENCPRPPLSMAATLALRAARRPSRKSDMQPDSKCSLFVLEAVIQESSASQVSSTGFRRAAARPSARVRVCFSRLTPGGLGVGRGLGDAPSTIAVEGARVQIRSAGCALP